MKEVWKTIEDYDNYAVSNNCEVKNIKRNTKKKLYESDGHIVVALWKNNKQFTVGIHRLIALAFIPIPENLKEIPTGDLDVHHIDFNPYNNNINNLCWLTHTKHREIHSNNKPIEQFTTDHEFVKEWNSAYEVEKILGYSQSNISKCCNNTKNYNTAYGFIWKYKEPQVS